MATIIKGTQRSKLQKKIERISLDRHELNQALNAVDYAVITYNLSERAEEDKIRLNAQLSQLGAALAVKPVKKVAHKRLVDRLRGGYFSTL